MDDRLQRVGGNRLSFLLYSDAPRVAQAITDAVFGRAVVRSGVTRNVSYIEFVRDRSYSVVIRGEDWRKIFPFLRYGVDSYRPVVPPPNPPSLIPSPQPNRAMLAPPEIPDSRPALTSFLAGLPFDEYSKIQRLLSTIKVNSLDAPAGPGVPRDNMFDACALVPSEQRTDGVNFREKTLYNHLVRVLQQLFPRDFPTRY